MQSQAAINNNKSKYPQTSNRNFLFVKYKKISIIPSDKLSHLCVNESMFITQKKKNYNEISVTQRNKHKFLTIIYITPK